MSVSIHTARQLLTPPPPPAPRPLVYGPDDVQKHFGVEYTPEQLAALAEVPFSEQTLKQCAGTHLLVAGAPLSLRDIRDRHPTLFYSRKPAWYDQQAENGWAAARVGVRWHLLRKEPVPESRRKTFDEQHALLSADEEVPGAGVVVYAVVLHALVTGERLLPNVWVRCADQSADGGRVLVGHFSRDGLGVNSDWDGSGYDSVGLAASRNVP